MVKDMAMFSPKLSSTLKIIKLTLKNFRLFRSTKGTLKSPHLLLLLIFCQIEIFEQKNY